jgi:hypothetical protein
LTTSQQICPFVCQAGQCAGVCVPGSLDCTGNTPMSCGTNGQWSLGTACPYACYRGACCTASTPDVCATGCVNLSTNNANCGACGVTCSGGKTCQSGSCACPAGQTDCSGTCADLLTSNANCGACGSPCVAGTICQAGSCVCPSGQTDCSGTCVDLKTNAAHCGSCGHVCGGGGGSCYAGLCSGTNLIANGDFSNGATYWGLSNASTGTSYSVAGGAFCITLPAYGTVTLGWPDAANVAIAAPLGAAQSYTFSYSAWATTTPSALQSKVGHAVSPYTNDYSTTSDVLTAAPTTFSHTFTQSGADTGAGVAFTVTGGGVSSTVCFDDVSIVHN